MRLGCTVCARALLIALTIAFAAGLGWPAVAAPLTLTVSKTTDTADGVCDADCSLREAVAAANANADANTIILPAGTFTLSIASTNEDANADGDLDIQGDLTIVGAGADTTTIVAATGDRVFELLADASVTITGVSLRGNGEAPDSGGVILVNPEATLLLRDSLVRDGRAVRGGAIEVLGDGINPASANATIERVTFTANRAGSLGGALSVFNGGSALLTNVTMTANSAGNSGGAISVSRDQALVSPPVSAVALNNVTITGNIADDNQDNIGEGGGVSVRIDNQVINQLALRNTIISDNTDRSPISANANHDCFGILTSQGYNLIHRFIPANCTILGTLTGNLTGSSARPAALINNGGTVPTVALLSGSPAIDAGDPDAISSCAPTDQRGVARPIDGDGNGVTACDMGAVEMPPLGPADLALTLIALPDPVEPGGVVVYSAIVANTGPGATGSIQLQFTPPIGASNVQLAGAGWDCVFGSTISCVRGALAAGDVAPALTVTLTVPPGGGAISANAIVTSGQTDPQSANNSASTTTFRGRVYAWLPWTVR